MDELQSINLIYRNPKVRNGMPCIVGTGLRVLDVVMAMLFGHRTVDELAEDYDLPLAKVHAALAYYYCNKDEIDRDIREDIRCSHEAVREGFVLNEKTALLQSVFPKPGMEINKTVQRALEQAIVGVGSDIEKRVLEIVEAELG